MFFLYEILAAGHLRRLTTVFMLLALLTPSPPVAAGEVKFAVIGDFGTGSAAQEDVADMIQAKNVSFVATVGDNVYGAREHATPWDAIDSKVGRFYHRYIFPYQGRYGSGSADAQNNFFPLLGNHDYGDGGATDAPLITCRESPALRSCSRISGAWYDYFSLPGNERYYSIRRGPVEVFLFSDYYRDPDWDYDPEKNGVIYWLNNALARSTAPWKIVLLHYPPYVSNANGGNENRRLPYRAWGADAVIAGHTHVYERLDVGGFPYFVNGAGGASVAPSNPISNYSVTQIGNDFGAMIISARASRIDYQYFTRDGKLRDTLVRRRTNTSRERFIQFDSRTTDSRRTRIHPSPAGFQARAGEVRGQLRSWRNADHMLILQHRTEPALAWRTVARSTRRGRNEVIRYPGSAGLYRWIVRNQPKNGPYQLRTWRR